MRIFFRISWRRPRQTRGQGESRAEATNSARTERYSRSTETQRRATEKRTWRTPEPESAPAGRGYSGLNQRQGQRCFGGQNEKRSPRPQKSQQPRSQEIRRRGVRQAAFADIRENALLLHMSRFQAICRSWRTPLRQVHFRLAAMSFCSPNGAAAAAGLGLTCRGRP